MSAPGGCGFASSGVLNACDPPPPGSLVTTTGPADDPLNNFYVPALSASVKYDRSAGFFTAAHAGRLQAFADQAAVAFEHAQLYEMIHAHAEDLEKNPWMGPVFDEVVASVTQRPVMDAVQYKDLKRPAFAELERVNRMGELDFIVIGSWRCNTAYKLGIVRSHRSQIN